MKCTIFLSSPSTPFHLSPPSSLGLAEDLGMAYAGVIEFEEIESPMRTPLLQGGGFHGNGILSKWDIKGMYMLVLM